MLLTLVVSGCGPTQEEIEATVQASIVETEMAKPTNTPQPTNTPKPTATYTPEPDTYEQEFGTLLLEYMLTLESIVDQIIEFGEKPTLIVDREWTDEVVENSDVLVSLAEQMIDLEPTPKYEDFYRNEVVSFYDESVDFTNMLTRLFGDFEIELLNDFPKPITNHFELTLELTNNFKEVVDASP